MTTVQCPECAHQAELHRSIAEGAFEWRCPGCGNSFEVRTAFFPRRATRDKERFRAEARAALEREGLTQAELGRLVGVSGAYVSTILSGRREVSPEVADRVAQVLQLPPPNS